MPHHSKATKLKILSGRQLLNPFRLHSAGADTTQSRQYSVYCNVRYGAPVLFFFVVNQSHYAEITPSDSVQPGGLIDKANGQEQGNGGGCRGYFLQMTKVGAGAARLKQSKQNHR